MLRARVSCYLLSVEWFEVFLGERYGAPADSPLGTVTTSELEPESLAILYAARERGIIEVRAVNSAFDAAARLLAVYVELDEERTIAFRDAKSPEVTLRFLAGFRNLCERGLILHHIFRDFSLSPHAFEIARTISKTDVQVYLDMATEFGLHD